MTKAEFERLTERYIAGKCTPEEVAFVEKWVDSSFAPEGEELVFESEAEAKIVEEEVWINIRDAAGISHNPNNLWNRNWFLVSMAASVALLLVSGVIFYGNLDKDPELAMIGLETHNTSANHQRIILPDSSIVILAKGAGIITSENYGEQTRTVRLTGEAFFEVKRNPKKPFLVYSGELVTEVLGTSFNVKPELDKKTIEVSVVTGKVSVYTSEKDRNKRRSGVIIHLNQKVVYNTELKSIRQDIVDDPKIILQHVPELTFKFDEVRVEAVLATLRHAYGMEIVVNNSGINNCKFTGNLNGYDLFKQLNYICDAIDAHYEVRGTTIFLTGRGCKDSG